MGRSFFNQPTPRVARLLLGAFLVRRIGTREIALPISEVEVYDGHHDKASHASRGSTKRNAPMFGHPGQWYVYLVYGCHWMLNIVTREKGYPAAVLIRGAGDISGPGRVTKHLQIGAFFNGRRADFQNKLWIEDRGFHIPSRAVIKMPRVGVAYAGPIWSRKRWRFLLRPQFLNRHFVKMHPKKKRS